MNNIFKDLNDKQIEAVTAIDGNIKVTAGAGSGKTRVLAHRYAFLVNEVGINPSNILCMTFTNKAAQEMRFRIARMVHVGDVNDFVCTIHSFCVKFLREEIFRMGYPKNFEIIDDEDAKDLAKQVIDEFNLKNKYTVKKFLEDIVKKRKYRESYITNHVLPNSKEGKLTSFSRYLKLQLKSFALDFDDLINYTLFILTKYKEVRKKWQDKIYYIMVDEAQDCNKSDWAIINTLRGTNHNLFIVGDPDQAIYEWRGAVPTYFIEFRADQDVILDENYRSTPNILSVANSVISNNSNRIKKELFTEKKDGSKTIYYHGKSDEDEGLWIANQIKQLKNNNIEYSDFAILYRASHMSRFVEQALLKKKIPYVVWGGIRFFERKEIKDALAYLRLAAYKDDISLRRIINVPSRKFGKMSLQKLSKYAEEDKSNLFTALKEHESEFKNAQIHGFITLIEEAASFSSEHSISDTLDLLLNKSKYKDTLRFNGDQERLDNLEELLNSVKYYEKENKNEPELTIDNYLQEIALYTNADFKKETKTVKLMTIHQSKGLEFPYVFVCGLTEGIFPSYRSVREGREAALEEERRLMYVAITRAKRALFLTESEGYNYSTKSDKYPSRFLTEIKDGLIKVEGNLDPYLLEGTKKTIDDLDIELNPNKPLKFKRGEIVEHQYFGLGKITSSNKDNRTYKVKFKNFTRDIDERALSIVEPEKVKQLNKIKEEAKDIPFLFVCMPLYEDVLFKKLENENKLKKISERMDSYRAEGYFFSLKITLYQTISGQYFKCYTTGNYTGNTIFHIGNIIKIGEDLYQIQRLVKRDGRKNGEHYIYKMYSFKEQKIVQCSSTNTWKRVFSPVVGCYYERHEEHEYLFLKDIHVKDLDTEFFFIESENLTEIKINIKDIEKMGLSPCDKHIFIKNCKKQEEFKKMLKI